MTLSVESSSGLDLSIPLVVTKSNSITNSFRVPYLSIILHTSFCRHPVAIKERKKERRESTKTFYYLLQSTISVTPFSYIAWTVFVLKLDLYS